MGAERLQSFPCGPVDGRLRETGRCPSPRSAHGDDDGRYHLHKKQNDHDIVICHHCSPVTSGEQASVSGCFSEFWPGALLVWPGARNRLHLARDNPAAKTLARQRPKATPTPATESAQASPQSPLAALAGAARRVRR